MPSCSFFSCFLVLSGVHWSGERKLINVLWWPLWIKLSVVRTLNIVERLIFSCRPLPEGNNWNTRLVWGLFNHCCSSGGPDEKHHFELSLILSWDSFWAEPHFNTAIFLSWTLFLFNVRQTFSRFWSQLSFHSFSLLAQGGYHTIGPRLCCFRLDYSRFSCLRPNTLSLCK